ncbi:MAG TPA: hypothetical protein VFQ61_17645 [Polyangiaceae bacterium]|nr:hypothetical protein [Polyangiaceae bacterium]
MQAEPSLFAGPVHVRPGESRALNTKSYELGRYMQQRESHATVHDHWPARRPELYSPECAPDQHGSVHSSLGFEHLELDILRAELIEARLPARDQCV